MLSAIQKCALFSGISGDILPDFIKSIGAEIVQYKKGELIFTQLDEPLKTMALLKGTVAVCNDSSEGKRNVVARFDKPGELFGEVFVFLGKKTYGNYSQAVTDVKILEIPRSAFTSANENENCSRMISNMMSILAGKAYFLNQRLQIVSSVTLRQKITKFLLMKADENKVKLNMTREELADYLNTTRPSLSRELMKMKDEGLITVEGKSMTLVDTKELKRLL